MILSDMNLLFYGVIFLEKECKNDGNFFDFHNAFLIEMASNDVTVHNSDPRSSSHVLALGTAGNYWTRKFHVVTVFKFVVLTYILVLMGQPSPFICF